MVARGNSRPWFWDLLACPDCGTTLNLGPRSLDCLACNYSTDAGQRPLDLMPIAPRPHRLDVPRVYDAGPDLANIDLTRPPRLYGGPPAQRDSGELFSALLASRPTRGALLDLGCGPRDQAGPAEFLGFDYVGLDIAGNDADIRADAHAIPFAADSVDIVLSYAVLEHLHNPFVAATEIRRVLRPGGAFIGTVSQGEPFHSSYFHHTPWGFASVVSVAGLHVERLWPSTDTLRSLSKMGRYSRAARWGLRLLDGVESRLQFLAPRRWLRWSAGEKLWDACVRAGSLCFVVRKL